MADNKKKSKFNLYNFFHNPDRDIEDAKGDGPVTYGFFYFFKLYFRNIGRLFYVNLFYLFGNFPILFVMLALSGFVSATATTPLSSLFPTVSALIQGDANPASAALYTVFGMQTVINVPTVASKIFLALGLLLIFTFGPVNVGTSYQLREIVKRQPVFLWSDFWYAIKRNLRQSIILGILDLIFGVMFVYDVFFFYANLATGTFFAGIMFFISLLVLLIYFAMRFYMYLILVTFDISIPKIIKNSVIFALLGFKRNFMAFAGIAVIAVLTMELMIVYLPIGIIIPLVIGVSSCAFVSTYCAYPKIKEIMIDPYYPNYGKSEEPKEEELPDEELL